MREEDGHAPSGAPAAQDAHPSRSAAETERVLVSIFAKLLSIPDVSPSENFFDLGATSLLMVRARNEIKEQLGREVAMNDLFANTSISDLARFLEGKDNAAEAVGTAQVRGARQNSLFQKLRKFAGKTSQ